MDHLLYEASVSDQTNNRDPPRGLELIMGNATHSHVEDSLVMSNLGTRFTAALLPDRPLQVSVAYLYSYSLILIFIRTLNLGPISHPCLKSAPPASYL